VVFEGAVEFVVEGVVEDVVEGVVEEVVAVVEGVVVVIEVTDVSVEVEEEVESAGFGGSDFFFISSHKSDIFFSFSIGGAGAGTVAEVACDFVLL
jgi:hypothetical protein